MMYVLIIALAIVACIFIPLGAIWSLNLLFGLAIPYSFHTWLAAFLLSSIVYGKTK